eukprot:scaffold87321_cov37-Attheya_sp.AAC.3
MTDQSVQYLAVTWLAQQHTKFIATAASRHLMNDMLWSGLVWSGLTSNILVTHFKGHAWDKFSNNVKVKV